MGKVATSAFGRLFHHLGNHNYGRVDGVRRRWPKARGCRCLLSPSSPNSKSTPDLYLYTATMFAVTAALPVSSSAAAAGFRRVLRLPVVGGSTGSRMACVPISTTPHASKATEVVKEEAAEKPKPWLFVGLGNPGRTFRGTRHNVGFDMLDAIADAEGISVSSSRFKALFGKGYIGNVPVILAKPQTFMNASGESVALIVSYYDIPLNQVLVMYDDLDLPFASLRMLPKGGHGGHNGMRSILDRFKGDRNFLRLRIGIGRPPGKMDPVNFVLRPFNKKELEELEFTFQVGLEAVRVLTQEGFDRSAKFANTSKS